MNRKIKYFIWQGYSKNNEKIRGLIDADNLPMAKIKLYKENIKVTRIYQQSWIKKYFFYSSVKKNDIVIFTRQLATLIIAGIPLIRALELLSNHSNNPYFSFLIQEIKQKIKYGASLSEALQHHIKYFDTLFCNLIAAGEQSGTLDILLEDLALYQEKKQLLQKKLRKALSYPIVIISIATIVTAILLIKVIPQFELLFQNNGKQIPNFTALILKISLFSQQYGWLLLLVLLLFSINYIIFIKYSLKFRRLIDSLLLRLIILGPLLKKAAIARFCRTLATTYAAGMSILDALTVSAKASNNLFYQEIITKIYDDIASGEQFNYAMQKTAVFPPVIVQMIAIGEESGSLEDMLYKVAQMYEQEIEIVIDNLSSLLEPIIISILGIIIGSIVIAMYLPIFNMGKVF